jgi:hypothetical protein
MEKKITHKEMVAIFIKTSMLTANEYMELRKKTMFDKQNWMWLHMGMVAAFTFCGYSEKFIEKALEEALEAMKPIMKK